MLDTASRFFLLLQLYKVFGGCSRVQFVSGVEIIVTHRNINILAWLDGRFGVRFSKKWIQYASQIYMNTPSIYTHVKNIHFLITELEQFMISCKSAIALCVYSLDIVTVMCKSVLGKTTLVFILGGITYLLIVI